MTNLILLFADWCGGRMAGGQNHDGPQLRPRRKPCRRRCRSHPGRVPIPACWACGHRLLGSLVAATVGAMVLLFLLQKFGRRL